MTRTHTVSQLPEVEEGTEVVLAGWVHRRRDHGPITFIDLRNRQELVQVVVRWKEIDEALKESLKPESVVEIKGKIAARKAGSENKDIATGSIEVVASEITILNESLTPPFVLDDAKSAVGEETRLKYRYLDLRREEMQKNLKLRSNVISFFREYLNDQDFLEVETPILTKGTPEGAREFIVPSRLHPGNFYVLPQSPQQFKQLLMVGGVEKYFQFARCFRDEDARADRDVEFTQLDIEMSFVEQEDILQLGEDMMNKLVDRLNELGHNYKISKKPWPRITYAESVEKYGTDKPDLRENKDDPHELAFCWIVDFPMFEKKADGTMQAAHHPFTQINPEDEKYMDTDPLKVRAWAYDIVLNGYELSSGSIRVHKRDLQDKIFKVLGLSDEQIQSKFGHMLEAFQYGAPPHGGFAPGIDRLTMVLIGTESLRNAIAFPKTSEAKDLMMGAPSPLDSDTLLQAGIRVVKK